MRYTSGSGSKASEPAPVLQEKDKFTDDAPRFLSRWPGKKAYGGLMRQGGGCSTGGESRPTAVENTPRRPHGVEASACLVCARRYGLGFFEVRHILYPPAVREHSDPAVSGKLVLTRISNVTPPLCPGKGGEGASKELSRGAECQGGRAPNWTRAPVSDLGPGIAH